MGCAQSRRSWLSPKSHAVFPAPHLYHQQYALIARSANTHLATTGIASRKRHYLANKQSLQYACDSNEVREKTA